MASIKQYQLKSGKKLWRVMYTDYTDPATGKQHRTQKRGFKTKREAEHYINHVLLDIDKHGYAANSQIKYFEVYDYFIKSYQETVKESTLNRVLGLFKHHILPELGNYPIKEISVPMCQNAVNTWADKLTDFVKVKAYASQVFKQAKKLGFIYDNPMDNVTIPKNHKKTAQVDVNGRHHTKRFEKENNFYDKDELLYFLDCLKKEYAQTNVKAYTLLYLLALTGMRKGEALALYWPNIDFKQGTINIDKSVTRTVDNKMIVGSSTKTANSERTINIDDKTLSLLNEWKKVQKKQLEILGLPHQKSKQLVFSNEHNGLMATSKPNKYLTRIIDKYQLKPIGVHGLRHTFASLAFESGATIKQVQVQLGHKDISTTMNVYAHVTKQGKKDTITKFTNYLDM